MEQYNLIITCKFSDFARAYTGLDDSENYMALIEEQNQMAFVDPQSNVEFLTETDMMSINDSMVEIRISYHARCRVFILNLTVTTPDVNNPYNGSVIECNCEDLETILHDIITHTFRY